MQQTQVVLVFPTVQPNDRWQADTTHWYFAYGTPVEIEVTP